MPADTPRPTPDRWRDSEGTHISLFCWIEQVAEHPPNQGRCSPGCTSKARSSAGP